MNQLPFPGNEVNSEHILYKKIDFIIENIKKNTYRTEINRELAIQFLEKPRYYLLSVHPILTFKNKIFDVHQKEIQSFIMENFNTDQMKGYNYPRQKTNTNFSRKPRRPNLFDKLTFIPQELNFVG